MAEISGHLCGNAIQCSDHSESSTWNIMHVYHNSFRIARQVIIIIYGICNAPLPKDTERRRQYNKNKQNRLRIKVSFKMRLEYGNRRSTADVYGDGVAFQGSSH